MWNTDPQGKYGPGDGPLYLNIPFYMGLHAGQAYGVFYDNSHRSRLDLGAASAGEATYLAEDGELRYYFFHGPALPTILERYTELTGHMPLLPVWALGYQQSRFSYYPESRVREIASKCRGHEYRLGLTELMPINGPEKDLARLKDVLALCADVLC